MSDAPPARATRATAFGTERVYPPGADYMVAPLGRHLRWSRFFGRLELVWDLIVLVPLTLACFGMALWEHTAAGPVLAWVFYLALAGVLAETLVVRLLWGGNVFRVLSHYYRHWLEPADSPRFCRMAVANHPLAVATILATLGCAWAGFITTIVGLRFWAGGRAEEGVALAVYGVWVVLVGVSLAVWRRGSK